jgi:hypothetical protein
MEPLDVRQDRGPLLADAGARPGHRVADGIWDRLAERAGRGDAADLLEELTPGQRALCVLVVAERQILNGGFGQFLENSTARFAPDLVPAAEAIGAEDYRTVFAGVVDLLPSEDLPASRDARQALLEEHLGEEEEERLAELEEELYELLETPDSSLEALIRAYVEAHAEEFFVDA